jgi:hypothetical protein
VNLEKLDAAIAHIEAHPEEHDQNWWFRKRDCGTTACLAGTLALLDGWEPVWPKRWTGWDYTSAEYVKKGGRRRRVPLVAREIIEATEWEAESLFGIAADLDDIKRYRDKIAAGEL